MSKNLIIYYSRKGQNYWNGSIKNLDKGNTEIVAEFIQKAVGGDLFEIETVKEYSADYYECIDTQSKSLTAAQDLNLKNTLTALMNMKIYSYAVHAGGALILWRCLRSLKDLIGTVKR